MNYAILTVSLIQRRFDIGLRALLRDAAAYFQNPAQPNWPTRENLANIGS